MKSSWLRTTVVLLACAWPAVARAQTSDDPVESARVQFGPFGLTPSVSLLNFGVDSNVFNTVEKPKRDFTLTLAPQLEAFFRAGPSRLSVRSRADLVYFHAYSSERSVDTDVDGRWEIRWNRVIPWVGGGYSSGRQRVGYEIDLRSRHEASRVAIGADVRVAPRTRVAITGRRSTYSYEADAVFLGSSLQDVLSRRSETVGLEYRQELTPLTTFVVEGEAARDRFDISRHRDSDSVRALAGLELAERALIFGRGRLGYRKFDGVGGGLPDFNGLVATFAVGTILKGRTRIEVAGERDVNYSYELSYPYFLMTGATVTATPRLTDKWDVQGRLGRQSLAYRVAPDAAVPFHDRVDRNILIGAGAGFHLGRAIRLGFNVDHQRRQSPVQSRDYKGYRVGTSVTYGR